MIWYFELMVTGPVGMNLIKQKIICDLKIITVLQQVPRLSSAVTVSPSVLEGLGFMAALSPGP